MSKSDYTTTFILNKNVITSLQTPLKYDLFYLTATADGVSHTARGKLSDAAAPP